MLDVLATAQHLKRLSRKARDEERFDEADALLTQAIEKLESEFARLQKRPSDEREKKLPASQEVRKVAAELADCLGSLGGVRRRQGRITEAVELYSRGKDLEQDDRYRIANSYNQVQWLVLRILNDPALLKSEKTESEIDLAIETVSRQIATTRREDPWAHSDLGLLKALAGDKRGALLAWRDMDDLKPVSSVYTSGIPVLESLANKITNNDGLQAGVERFAAAAQAH